VSPPTVLFDGECPFCRKQVTRLRRWAPDPSLRYRSFREPGALDEYPTLDLAACDLEMKFAVTPTNIFGGMEAAVRVMSRRLLFKPALLYYLPGLKQLLDAGYRWIAARRLKFTGGVCDDDVCSVHTP
jgi:predicted DCC family thiol-disulfide oxidoreductase YuxK